MFTWMKGASPRVPAVAAAFLLAGAMAAEAQGAPDYSGFSSSVCIPFVRQQSPQPPADLTPRLQVSVEGGTPQAIKMDTGSVGMAMSYDQIPGYETLKASPEARPGAQFLSSSKVLWTGTWVPVTITFFDGSTPLATSKVLVLGVEQKGICPAYKNGGVCPSSNTMTSAAGEGIAYLGVGFGQEADYQPQGTPDKNALLNLVTIGGLPVANTFNPGYIIGTTGVTIGLTPANTGAFNWIKLSPKAGYLGDWTPAGMCVQINGSPCEVSAGTVLVDTGIAHSYITVPSSVPFSLVSAIDPSDTSRTIGVLPVGTTVVVNLPGLPNPMAVYSFTITASPANDSPAPLLVIPQHGRTPFVNTGRHFLRQFQFLYDARNGYVGLKPQVTGCGG